LLTRETKLDIFNALDHAIRDYEAIRVSMDAGVAVTPFHKWTDQSAMLDFTQIFYKYLDKEVKDVQTIQED